MPECEMDHQARGPVLHGFLDPVFEMVVCNMRGCSELHHASTLSLLKSMFLSYSSKLASQNVRVKSHKGLPNDELERTRFRHFVFEG